MNNTPTTPCSFSFDAPVSDPVARGLRRIDLVRTIGPAGRQTRTSVALITVRDHPLGVAEVSMYCGRPDARYLWGQHSVGTGERAEAAIMEAKACVVARLVGTGDLPESAAEELLVETGGRRHF